MFIFVTVVLSAYNTLEPSARSFDVVFVVLLWLYFRERRMLIRLTVNHCYVACHECVCLSNLVLYFGTVADAVMFQSRDASIGDSPGRIQGH